MPTAPRGFTLVVNIDQVISMIKKAINNAKLLLIFLISYLTIPSQHPLDLRQGQKNLQPTIEYRNITGIPLFVKWKAGLELKIAAVR